MTEGSNRQQRGRRNFTSRSRQAAPQRFSDQDDGPESRAPKAPVMARSRAQLASTYAPGVLFTWEGAKGICRAVPIARDEPSLSDATKQLIRDGIVEIASNWMARGSTVRGNDPVEIELVLDDVFYHPQSREIQPEWHRDFQFVEPGLMGYVPFPLLYRCGTCGHLEEYESVREQARRPLPSRCGDHAARWSQVDVVYVHWSGNIEPLSPYRNYYDAASGQLSQIRQCKCGSRDFRLNNQSSVFRDWRFVCESCREVRDLQQPDPLTYSVLERTRREGGRTFEGIETNMLPVSYRANSAFYPQKGSFIEFRDRSVVDLLRHQRSGELLHVLADMHGIPFAQPSDADIQAALESAGRVVDWEDYSELLASAERFEQRGVTARAEMLRTEAASAKEEWYRDGIINRGVVQSTALTSAVQDRIGWARRYDPIRLTVEHDRFVKEHIEERKTEHEAVNVLEPDRLICDSVGDPQEMQRYIDTIRPLLERIGIAELVLIRGLPICEFSFGYSRVSATPVYHREFNGRSVAMPVRLNAFPSLPQNKRPIYVTQQKNEALYFRVDKERIRGWLRENGVTGVPPEDRRQLGATYLESYSDFGPFLEEFKGREGRGAAQRDMSAYTYMLLHSLSHQVMHAMADTSGLDRDALGEYIFPADFAFVVYRKGMTPDLGNISAMWRNHAAAFLRRILDPRMLRCGSGTLCDARGGACPACIMVSEVTCIAANQLLSRAALRGGPAPNWEPSDAAPLTGFFDSGLFDER